MQGILKWLHTFGIFEAFGLNASSVTTVPFSTFAAAITNGSATGVPRSFKAQANEITELLRLARRGETSLPCDPGVASLSGGLRVRHG